MTQHYLLRLTGLAVVQSGNGNFKAMSNHSKETGYSFVGQLNSEALSCCPPLVILAEKEQLSKQKIPVLIARIDNHVIWVIYVHHHKMHAILAMTGQGSCGTYLEHE